MLVAHSRVTLRDGDSRREPLEHRVFGVGSNACWRFALVGCEPRGDRIGGDTKVGQHFRHNRGFGRFEQRQQQVHGPAHFVPTRSRLRERTIEQPTPERRIPALGQWQAALLRLDRVHELGPRAEPTLVRDGHLCVGKDESVGSNALCRPSDVVRMGAQHTVDRN